MSCTLMSLTLGLTCCPGCALTTMTVRCACKADCVLSVGITVTKSGIDYAGLVAAAHGCPGGALVTHIYNSHKSLQWPRTYLWFTRPVAALPLVMVTCPAACCMASKIWSAASTEAAQISFIAPRRTSGSGLCNLQRAVHVSIGPPRGGGGGFLQAKG